MTTRSAEAEERRALITLAHIVEPGDRQVGRLVRASHARRVVDQVAGGTSGLRQQEGLAARFAAIDTAAADQRAAALGARILTRVDREWPSQLDDLAEAAPFALWAIGAANLRLTALRSVAVVGARACSSYGEEVARSWSANLAGEGWTVVSGGAFGIDAAAHRGALAAGGVTMCVLAGGVDQPYPRAHDALIARIGDEGLVISESPPGESVRRQRFLSRNRLIAGLTRATVVVEAAERSGTMATAQAALSMNRPLLAVPGPVTSPESAGCHRMVRDGAALLAGSVDDVLGVLDLGHEVAGSRSRVDARDALSDGERRVLDALPARRWITVDDLAIASGLPGRDLLAALGSLEAGEWVVQEGGGWRLAGRRQAAPARRRA